MPSTACTIFLLAAAITSPPFPDTRASRIDVLEVPRIVRNGTGPIDLSCLYRVRSDENGLVVKWYHNMDQIYQWIPPMPPQDVGVINGLAEYPEENLRQPNSQSVIHLRMATVEMSGEYTCTISTFQGEDSKRSRMIVYAPEKDATIHVSSFNETHLNLTCVVNGAYPRPILKFYVEGAEVHSYYDRTEKTEWYRKDLSVKRVVIVRNTFEPTLLDCEVSIPRTDYKRRERIIYYPAQSLSQISSASRNPSTFVYISIISLCRLMTAY
ncbi:uncharacterized protein LOC116432604 [Nomia melanderi]|uniref:uncharacterized protein LOC116432604 n=1 Tax=Nomia melanderi TaxID=2448451 RepID=UPI0013044AE1|nr:uncharacterized protein LOC116432604 [Nomia melanderi]